MLARVLAIALCLSVCLSVCHNQVGVLLNCLDASSSFWHGGFFRLKADFSGLFSYGLTACVIKIDVI